MWSSVASAVNFTAAILLVAVSTYAVLSPKVHDGVVVKLGLILVALGAGGLASALYNGLDTQDIRALTHSTLMLNIGLLIVIIGGVLRLRAPGVGRRRRVSDFVPLDEQSNGTFNSR